MSFAIYLILLISSVHVVEPAVMAVLSTIYNIYSMIDDAHSTYSKFTTPSTADLLDEILDIKEDINKVTKDITKKIDALYNQLITQLPKIGKLNRGMENFSRLSNRITYLYKIFERIIYPPQKIPTQRILKQFADVALSCAADSVDATLDALQELLIPSEIGHLNDGLLGLFVQNLPASRDLGYVCNIGASPEEQLYLLYTAILTSELRGFIIMSYTYSLLENLSGESYANAIRNGKSRTLTRIQRYMWEMRDLANWTSVRYYPCDPVGGFQRDISFAEFEMFISVFFVHKLTMLNDCSLTCDQFYGVRGVVCWRLDCFCTIAELASSVCTGQLIECSDYPANEISICVNQEPPFGSKRYVYLEAGEKKWGNSSDCTAFNQIQGMTNRKTGDDECSYCGCRCVEDQRKSKVYYFISLRPQLADIDENKVMSGIKFTMTKHVLYLQIQQGPPLGDEILAGKLEWKPYEILHVTENTIPTDENGNDYIEDVDFFRLTYLSRDFYLDDLIIPEGYIATGARLKNEPSNDAVQLEIRATPFNLTTSRVIISDDEPSIWITWKDMVHVLPEYDDVRSPVQEIMDMGSARMNFTDTTEVTSRPNQWIRTELSNLKGDMGGTVYPLLDIRPVSPSPTFLIQGVGLAYKQPHGSQGPGYLAFYLYSVNRQKFFDLEVQL